MNFHRFRIVIVGLISILNLAAQPKNPLFYHVYADYGMTSDKTTVTHQDYQGYIWIGTEEGLNKFISYTELDFDQYKSIRDDSSTLTNDYITTLFEDSKRNLWVGTMNGLCLYNRNLDNFTRISQRHEALMNKKVNAIVERENELWIATDDMLCVYDLLSDSIRKTFSWKTPADKQARFNDLYTTNDHVWVATSNGLYFAKDMFLDPIQGYEDVEVTSITLSEDGQIVTGTKHNGLWTLNKSGNITAYTTETAVNLTSNQVNDVLKISNGDIWVATNNGLTFLDLTTNTSKKLTYDFNKFYGLSDYEVRQLYQDNVGAIWMTSPLGGVNYYHESDNQFDYYGQTTSNALSNELMDYSVLSMYEDTLRNELWIGSRIGLSKYSEEEDIFQHFHFTLNGQRESNQILSIAEDSPNHFLLGTEKGLFSWNTTTKKFQPIDDHSDFKDQINVIYKDRSGAIWIGTQNNGLKRLSDQMDEFHIQFAVGEDRVSVPNINDIIQLSDGTVWVGTTSGLFYVNGNLELKSYPIRLNNEKILDSWVNYLCTSTEGKLIVGSRKEGLILIKPHAAQDAVMVNKEMGLATNDVRSMTRISDSLVWISTNVGLAKLTTNSDSVLKVTNFYLHDGLQGKQFTPKAGVALNKQVYFGGLSGLTHFNPTKVKEFDIPLVVNLTDLTINDQLIKPGSNSTIKKSISVSDTLVLGPDQNNFTISFMAMDYMRPDSVKYRYRLEKYDKNWMYSTAHNATYTNIPRGKQYTFVVQAVSRFRNWSEPRSIIVYMTPYFYETAWFKILIAFLTVGILFAVLRYREQASVIKQRNLKRLVDLRTKELKLEVEAKEKTAVELEKAKNDAEKANRIKSEFLANISHEIRTPLNGILGMSHLVSENEPNPENREMLNILGSSAKSLREIIDDLLDLSKIEAGKYDIAVEEFNLTQLAREIVMAFEPEARLKNIALLTHIDSDIPEMLIGDELRIKQVLVNLLSNSLKFTDSGSIELSINLLDNQENKSILQIGVRDTGIGIPYDKQDDVFSSFSQVESGSKRKYGGTGLGLAISKKLILLMGGTIVVESIPGEGSFFKIELALSKSDGPGITADLNIDLSVPEGRKILLVEDNAVNTIVATKMLQKTNQMVDTASNGKDALVKAEKNSYDLILMDIQMPVMDGLEATLKIRQSTGLSANTPIVALTAGAMHHDREKALKVGMSDFIPKPISYDQLEKVLIKYLNNPEEVPSMLR